MRCLWSMRKLSPASCLHGCGASQMQQQLLLPLLLLVMLVPHCRSARQQECMKRTQLALVDPVHGILACLHPTPTSSPSAIDPACSPVEIACQAAAQTFTLGMTGGRMFPPML